jgi:PadR family transcriptional regulator PadR
MAGEPPLLRDIQLAFMRIHILHHAVEHPIYGLWMRDELAEHGYDISVGTLYPILHQLEEHGYLTSDEQLHDGRRRRYYQATDEGKALLSQIQVKLAELTGETLPSSPGSVE